MNKYTWIQTRDGSPTLWSNDLSEAFRSVRGAYTESFKIFIEPSLADLQARPRASVTIGEFGLGPGTNWMMSQIFLGPRVEKLAYFAIERDASIFQTGLEKWREQAAALAEFATAHGQAMSVEQILAILEKPRAPLIIPSIDLAFQSGLRSDFWFHDPFGYDVNPEGYYEETLNKCRVFFKPGSLGCSYACNKFFQTALEKSGFKIEVHPSGDPLLKRERVVFRV